MKLDLMVNLKRKANDNMRDEDGFVGLSFSILTPTPTNTHTRAPIATTHSTSFNFIVLGIVMYETVVFECIWCDCNDIRFVCNMIDDVFADLLSENEMGDETENEAENEGRYNNNKEIDDTVTETVTATGIANADVDSSQLNKIRTAKTLQQASSGGYLSGLD